MDIAKQVKSWFGGGSFTKQLSKRLFGANNETLDFLMDSFYKLSPEQRAGAIFGSGLALVLVSLGVLWFYFASVDSLERELNQSFNSLHELRELKSQYDVEQARYSRLVQSISRKTASLRVKPFFEEKGQSLAIEIQGLTDTVEPMPASNPLSTKMQYVKVRMSLPKISIPRLMTLLVDVEKSNNYLAVEDLTIRSRYGTKLFFDAEVEFRGYSLQGGAP